VFHPSRRIQFSESLIPADDAARVRRKLCETAYANLSDEEVREELRDILNNDRDRGLLSLWQREFAADIVKNTMYALSDKQRTQCIIILDKVIMNHGKME